ncbi:hypothetical protein M5689_003801 [Euphorbia peplus]|nr:hypothetical protein M5689_003801 [Euphorbia peplus]
MSKTNFNVPTLIHMLSQRFPALEDYEQEEEIGQLSTLVGETNISILIQPNESDYAFRNRSFSELLLRLQPESLNTYKISFFGTRGAPKEIDMMIRKFLRIPVEKQEEEIRKLSELTGGELVLKSAKESEDKFKIRCVMELLLKLSVESVEVYKKTFFEMYGRPVEPRIKWQSMRLQLDEDAPAGFNRDYKPPANK